MERVRLYKDRLNKPEVVAEYLGVSKRALTEMSTGKHYSGRQIGCVEVTPRQRRFKYEHVMDYEAKYTVK
tara:strand:- start:665 stop:874 length:210 start_codon:yes stop_codon:yes gene_type:complete